VTFAKDTEILTSTLAFWTAYLCVHTCPQATLAIKKKDQISSSSIIKSFKSDGIALKSPT
jgi:hypothetical protein